MNHIEENKVQVVIDQVFSFHEVKKAYELLESKRAKGKIVVSI